MRLDLDGICIRTAVLRARRRLMERLLAGEDADPGPGGHTLDASPDASADTPNADSGAEVVAALELLDDFIATTDFAALRAGDPNLAGAGRCTVELRRAPDGRVSWNKSR